MFFNHLQHILFLCFVSGKIVAILNQGNATLSTIVDARQIIDCKQSLLVRLCLAPLFDWDRQKLSSSPTVLKNMREICKSAIAEDSSVSRCCPHSIVMSFTSICFSLHDSCVENMARVAISGLMYQECLVSHLIPVVRISSTW